MKNKYNTAETNTRTSCITVQQETYKHAATQPVSPNPSELPSGNHKGQPVPVAKGWDNPMVAVKSLPNLLIAGCLINKSKFNFRLHQEAEPNLKPKSYSIGVQPNRNRKQPEVEKQEPPTLTVGLKAANNKHCVTANQPKIPKSLPTSYSPTRPLYEKHR